MQASKSITLSVFNALSPENQLEMIKEGYSITQDNKNLGNTKKFNNQKKFPKQNQNNQKNTEKTVSNKTKVDAPKKKFPKKNYSKVDKAKNTEVIKADSPKDEACALITEVKMELDEKQNTGIPINWADFPPDHEDVPEKQLEAIPVVQNKSETLPGVPEIYFEEFCKTFGYKINSAEAANKGFIEVEGTRLLGIMKVSKDKFSGRGMLLQLTGKCPTVFSVFSAGNTFGIMGYSKSNKHAWHYAYMFSDGKYSCNLKRITSTILNGKNLPEIIEHPKFNSFQGFHDVISLLVKGTNE